MQPVTATRNDASSSALINEVSFDSYELMGLTLCAVCSGVIGDHARDARQIFTALMYSIGMFDERDVDLIVSVSITFRFDIVFPVTDVGRHGEISRVGLMESWSSEIFGSEIPKRALICFCLKSSRRSDAARSTYQMTTL